MSKWGSVGDKPLDEGTRFRLGLYNHDDDDDYDDDDDDDDDADYDEDDDDDDGDYDDENDGSDNGETTGRGGKVSPVRCTMMMMLWRSWQWQPWGILCSPSM